MNRPKPPAAVHARHLIALITALENADEQGINTLIGHFGRDDAIELLIGAAGFIAGLMRNLHEANTGSTEGWLEMWALAIAKNQPPEGTP